MTANLHISGDCPLLEVLISTFGRDGIERTGSMQLPRVDGVGYVVSWQNPDGEIPESLGRNDVRVVKSSTLGLSNNRNDAFDASRAEILLIADDDLNYTAEGLRAVIDIMQSHPELDFATFRHTGGDEKAFPDFEFDLNRKVKNYYVTSFEIAVRRCMVTGENAVRFDTNFGIGADRFKSGEEEFFVVDALHAGFKGRFFPLTIVEHKGKTTSYRMLTRGVLEAQGVYLRECYPMYSALPRIGVIAWRHYRAGRCRLLPAMWHMFSGWLSGRPR